jgi:ribosome-associated protein
VWFIGRSGVRFMLIVNERISIPLDEFQFKYTRSGGPGGQNVNKVASKATLRWSPGQSASLPDAVRERLLRSLAGRLTLEGELLVSSQRTRDRGRNVEDCLDKVRRLIQAAASPPKVRRASRPTLASKVRRGEAKARRSERKRERRRPAID